MPLDGIISLGRKSCLFLPSIEEFPEGENPNLEPRIIMGRTGGATEAMFTLVNSPHCLTNWGLERFGLADIFCPAVGGISFGIDPAAPECLD